MLPLASPSPYPKWLLDHFSHFCATHGRQSWYITVGHPLSLKIALFVVGSWPHQVRGSLGPPESATQTASQLVQPFLHGSQSWQTDRQADHTTPSVTIGRIYVCSTVMQPNNDVRNRYGDGSTRAPLRWTLASCSKYSYLNVLVTINSNKLLQWVLAKACNTQSNIDGWHCWPSYSVTDTTANNVDKNDSWQCQSSAVNVGLCITDITLVDLDSALKWLFFNGNNNRPTHFKTTLSFYLQMLNS